MSKNIIVIGAGFAGLSAATTLADKGYKVTLLEKNESAGGRARVFKAEGFTFDMGPSWYWMPDVFERYFARFGKKVEDYYKLIRLSPSYRVCFGENDFVDIPSDLNELYALFESYEKGSSQKLQELLKDSAYKYEVGINKLVYKPSLSVWEFVDIKLLIDMIRMNIFESFHKYARKYFKNEKLLKLIEFPILFLGAIPQNTPALYSLMNYADISLGTWYPIGGMHKIVDGMVSLAQEKGVKILYNQEVKKIKVIDGQAKQVITDTDTFEVDAVVAGADYEHIDQKVLEKPYQSYSKDYWDKRVMSPSSLIFYLGLNKKLENVKHHTLFFDEDFSLHSHEIYTDPKWPSKPLFYTSIPSQTDPSVASEGTENLFILIPVAVGLDDSEETREYYYNLVMDRFEKLIGQNIREAVIYKRSYAHKDFSNDYHSFRGNAYGLANTLMQTAVLKPSLKSKKVKNLYFTGQLTVPGPGVPPSLISGQVVAEEIAKKIR
ncbi:phytoene dehydrogenase [bacterium 336/3]|nr:phytoene dehydrogenase [bacterium 336/3]